MATPQKPRKIGLVIDTSLDPTDGVQQYVLSIGDWLSQQGHDVHYLAGQTDKRKLPNLHSLSRNITVSFNGNRTTIPLPTSRRKLRNFIQKEQFDVLHVQTPHHPLMAQRLILAASPQTAVVGTFHILPYGALSRIGTRLLGWWLRPSLKPDGLVVLRSSIASGVDVVLAVLELAPLARVGPLLVDLLETITLALPPQHMALLLLSVSLAVLVLAWAMASPRERGVPHVSLVL